MDNSTLDYLFHPRSIAIAGVSPDQTKFNVGLRYMQSLFNSGFKGEVYPVGPGGGEISGSRIYRSIRDIPDSVDYTISAIPARYTPHLVADCATKGVKAIHFFTAGFGEIEDERGGQLESAMLEIARQSGIRIIGPNCMGLYCPRTGLSFGLDLPRRSGPVGLFAQSGVNSVICIREATARGVYFSKVVSYGNAGDLNESDFLKYFAGDLETKVITAYIEGVREGSRFATALREAAKAKPVVVLKAGATEAGTRAAASHTSAIAGSNEIWRNLLRQAGAIQVNSIEEMVDVNLTLLSMPLPKGRNVAIIGQGGGPSVLAADDCLNAGLAVPMLPVEVRQRLKDIYASETGSSFRNPVDLNPFLGSKTLVDAIRTVADCGQVDLLIIHVPFDIWLFINSEYPTGVFIEAILHLNNVVSKPVGVVLYSQTTDEARQLASEAQSRLREAGFAVYPSIGRAASAINKVIEYHEWRQKATKGIASG